jgi:hypothetical protein
MLEYTDKKCINIHIFNKIKYGTLQDNIDITDRCLEKCVTNNRIIIPNGDPKRIALFGDPHPNIIKSIFVDNTDIEFNKKKLEYLQSNLILDYGSFSEEYPEQLNVTTYLKGNEKVLEIGANIGRVSLQGINQHAEK